MKTKVFKTIDEQINILQERGLTIDDIDFAKEELIRENYFFINGYRHLFLESGSDKYYKEGTNFREIIALFNFDRQIRNTIKELGGTMPEDLPTPEKSLKQLEKEKKKLLEVK